MHRALFTIYLVCLSVFYVRLFLSYLIANAALATGDAENPDGILKVLTFACIVSASLILVEVLFYRKQKREVAWVINGIGVIMSLVLSLSTYFRDRDL
ncbi:hypothetical protein GCM10023313_20020 [Mucilaginibacter defluvii]|uniref:Uncharacterized protein n=1 Tax=Mucilaginibacter defluvii TaxID=1196019 RepID=A0ABP9FTJ2_9SPHI